MTVWFWSDLHLGHERIYSEPFTSATGSGERMRLFGSAEAADNYMVSQYNSKVGPTDTVYFLGDIAFTEEALKKLGQMNFGKKVLVMGNHDRYPIGTYAQYFASKRMRGAICKKDYRAVLTHIPIHPSCMDGRWDLNIHGHTHDRLIPNPHYINVCVENTGYAPISWEEINDKTKMLRM